MVKYGKLWPTVGPSVFRFGHVKTKTMYTYMVDHGSKLVTL